MTDGSDNIRITAVTLPLPVIGGAAGAFPRFLSATVIDGKVHLSGFEKYAEAGCVPYLFRKIKKVNKYRKETPDGDTEMLGSSERSGWNLFGRPNDQTRLLSIGAGGIVTFDTSDINKEYEGMEPGTGSDSLMCIRHLPTSLGEYISVGWGKQGVRMLKDGWKVRSGADFKFAIAYGKPTEGFNWRITPADMESNLAVFGVHAYVEGQGSEEEPYRVRTVFK